MHGQRGEDVEVGVPVGTQVWLEDGQARLLADLVRPGGQVCVAVGGSGGRGNTRFASPINRFPRLAEGGEAGQELDLRLELKLLADVGIIGMPNAGKSSLLAAVSAARPKIAGYPFTTIQPMLGVVERHDRSFVLADIPGLIGGAHRGVGLGHDFLRHVDRTKVLIHVVDVSVEDPVGDYRGVNKELRLFSKELSAKPQVLALNKIDMPEARAHADAVQSELADDGLAVHLISAVSREGVDALLDDMLEMLSSESKRREGERDVVEDAALPVLTPKPRRDEVKVHREGSTYVVTMPAATRIAAMVDENDWNARMQFHSHLKWLGVIRTLEAEGIEPGDTVRIGKVEWEWE